MNQEHALILFQIPKRHLQVDLELPLNITTNELVIALNQAYGLEIDTSDIKNCYLKAEDPLTLIKGNKRLSELGVRNGTIINYTE